MLKSIKEQLSGLARYTLYPHEIEKLQQKREANKRLAWGTHTALITSGVYGILVRLNSIQSESSRFKLGMFLNDGIPLDIERLIQTAYFYYPKDPFQPDSQLVRDDGSRGVFSKITLRGIRQEEKAGDYFEIKLNSLSYNLTFIGRDKKSFPHNIWGPAANYSETTSILTNAAKYIFQNPDVIG